MNEIPFHEFKFLGTLAHSLYRGSPMIEHSDKNGRYEGIGRSETHVLVAVLNGNQADLIEESNFETMVRLIGQAEKEHPSDHHDDDSDMWDMTGRHWACGYQRELWVRVCKESGSPTDAYMVAVDCLNRLQDYPLLDEEDVSSRESERFWETTQDVFSSWCWDSDISSNLVEYDIRVLFEDCQRVNDCQLGNGECDQHLMAEILDDILAAYWKHQYRKAGHRFGVLVAAARERYGRHNVEVVRGLGGRLAIKTPELPKGCTA